MKACVFLTFGLFIFEGRAADVSRSIAALPVSLMELTQTQSTDFEVDMGGRKRIQRRYDEEGALVEQQVTDFSQHPPLVEKLVITKEPEVWLRTVKKGEVLIRREEERYSSPGELFEREIVWSSNEDGNLDRKSVMEYEGIEILITLYEKQGDGKWKQVGQKSENAFDSSPSGYTRNTRDLAVAVNKLQTYKGGHLSCLKDKYPSEDEACLGKLLNGAESFGEAGKLGPDYNAFLDCRDRFSPVYYLASRYRIDTRTCYDKDGQEAIKAAAEKAFFGGLSCLKQVNPTLALKFFNHLDATRMLIKCSGNNIKSEDELEAMCKTSSTKTKQACREFIEFHSKSSAGAYLGGHSMHLFSADPCRYPEAKDDPKLEQTIFHETLHAMDLHTSSEHNKRPPDLGDAVFGCEAMCGGNPKRLTKEGCEACILAFHEKDDRKKYEGKLGFCKQFPSAALRREVAKWRYVVKLVAACSADGKSRDCETLFVLPEFKENCDKKNGLSNKCKKRLYGIAAQGLLGLGFNEDVYKTVEAVYRNEPELTIEEGKEWDYKEKSKTSRRGKELLIGQLVFSFCAQVTSFRDDEAESFVNLRAVYDKKVGAEAEGYRIPFLVKDVQFPLFKERYSEKSDEDFKNARAYCEKFLPVWSQDIGSEEF